MSVAADSDSSLRLTGLHVSHIGSEGNDRSMEVNLTQWETHIQEHQRSLPTVLLSVQPDLGGQCQMVASGRGRLETEIEVDRGGLGIGDQSDAFY